MITELTNTRVELARSGLLDIEARAGFAVACESGLVWVTVEGEATDHWLVAGDSVSVRRPGRVIVEAAQASRVALREPEKTPWRLGWPGLGRRLARRFAGALSGSPRQRGARVMREAQQP